VGILATERIGQPGAWASESQAEAEAWAQKARQQLTRVALQARPGEIRREAKKHGNAALAIWLGIGLDAIPESLVIGMLVVAAAAESTTISLAFVVGVFLANLPEAMSSAVTMVQGGMHVPRVMWMWLSLCLLTGAGALLGTILLPESATGAMVYVVFAIEGLAGGAMLTMIAQTMLPEAYEQGGGPIVGLSTLAGFLAAMAAKLIH
jgi:zinc transporter ZupT